MSFINNRVCWTVRENYTSTSCQCTRSTLHGMMEQRFWVQQTHTYVGSMCMYKCMFYSELKWKHVHASAPTHKQSAPQLFLWESWVSGSDSCRCGLNRARTVVKKTCSAHCSEVSLPLSLSRVLSGGQTKDTGNSQHWHSQPQWAWYTIHIAST